MEVGMSECLQMVNVKVALLRAKKAQKWELRYSSTLSLTSALDGNWNVWKFTDGKCKDRLITGQEGPEVGVKVLLYSFFNLGATW